MYLTTTPISSHRALIRPAGVKQAGIHYLITITDQIYEMFHAHIIGGVEHAKLPTLILFRISCLE